MLTRWVSLFVVLAGSLLATPTKADIVVTSPSTQPATPASVIVIDGEINDFVATRVKQGFAHARAAGAKTVILSINTYGGLVTSGLEISQFLKRQDDLHVVAFVTDKAISAGAMIAVACDEIVMQPLAKIGDCAPISVGSGGKLEKLEGTERAKMESPILEDFYESARVNGRDPLLLQAMVSMPRVVHYIESTGGEKRFVDETEYSKLLAAGWKPVAGVRDPLDSADSLLTCSTDTAVAIGLANSTSPSLEDFTASRNFNIVSRDEPGTGTRFVELLGSPAVRGLAMTLFLVCIYSAFSHPGHGFPEVGAVVTGAVLIGVPMMTGYASWLELLMILAGITFLALEVFVIPGFGVTGITGIILVLLGLVLTFVGAEPSGMPGVLPSLSGTYDGIVRGFVVVTIGMAGSMLLWVWLARFLPKLPVANRLVLNRVVGTTPEPGQVEIAARSRPWPLVGAIGTARTELKPGGSASFVDEMGQDLRIISVSSDAGFVSPGSRVVIREVKDNRVLVRALDVGTHAGLAT